LFIRSFITDTLSLQALQASAIA